MSVTLPRGRKIVERNDTRCCRLRDASISRARVETSPEISWPSKPPPGAIFAHDDEDDEEDDDDDDDDDDEREQSPAVVAGVRLLDAHTIGRHTARDLRQWHTTGDAIGVHTPGARTFRRLTARKSHAVIESAGTLFRASKYSFPSRVAALETSDSSDPCDSINDTCCTEKE
ncbi:hypothetical protein K0M31_004354 [Melipona bicolor]|uniref:Uncharacterized protein n=1 Tax=Melipona bicolor TaxID=60889 RepID=A0AA40FX88_9HYME|nr:hypothetical protein K0M31_004354 [Melipona bicolor]